MSQGTPAAAFQVFADLLRARSGLAIGPEKLYLLETRLSPILRREKLRDLSQLADMLRSRATEPLINEVVEAMTTNESFFFRDGKPFRHFQATTLPELLASRPREVPLRIWSAAASSGQEAYSLAMVLTDHGATRDRRCTILGTDIARAQLARARDGLYSQFEVQRGLPVQMLVKHFRKEGTDWRIHEALRAMVEFREWNLLADLAPLGRFDVVFCRNVLIYFDPPTKARVLAAIARQMPEDGILYLGGTESMLGVTNAFVPIPGEHGIYKKTP